MAEAGLHTCFPGANGKCWQCLKPIPKPAPKKKPPTKTEQRARADNRAELSRHHSAKRRAERSSRTPPWADLDKIRELHREARRLTLETGIPYHVDHVIPLQGKNVSGPPVALVASDRSIAALAWLPLVAELVLEVGAGVLGVSGLPVAWAKLGASSRAMHRRMAAASSASAVVFRFMGSVLSGLVR